MNGNEEERGDLVSVNERDQLSSLSKNEKRFLARRVCALCDMPLNRKGCSGIYYQCSAETRIQRRINCLKTYRSRKRMY